MARFYFILHECGSVFDDEEGQELPDLAAARERAVREARELMREEVKHGRLCLDCCVVIEDANRVEVAKMPFRDAVLVTGR